MRGMFKTLLNYGLTLGLGGAMALQADPGQAQNATQNTSPQKPQDDSKTITMRAPKQKASWGVITTIGCKHLGDQTPLMYPGGDPEHPELAKWKGFNEINPGLFVTRTWPLGKNTSLQAIAGAYQNSFYSLSPAAGARFQYKFPHLPLKVGVLAGAALYPENVFHTDNGLQRSDLVNESTAAARLEPKKTPWSETTYEYTPDKRYPGQGYVYEYFSENFQFVTGKKKLQPVVLPTVAVTFFENNKYALTGVVTGGWNPVDKTGLVAFGVGMDLKAPSKNKP